MLAAALGVLADRGLHGFTVEAVARRAGASKATIYRRWSSRNALLLHAMDSAFRPLPTPATGTLRTDLLEILTGGQDLLTKTRFAPLMAAFIDAAERDPALAGLHFQLTERRREPVRQALERARERGEIPSGVDAEIVIDLLTAPLFYRRFIAHRPLGAAYVSALVEHVLDAIASRVDPPSAHRR